MFELLVAGGVTVLTWQIEWTGKILSTASPISQREIQLVIALVCTAVIAAIVIATLLFCKRLYSNSSKNGKYKQTR